MMRFMKGKGKCKNSTTTPDLSNLRPLVRRLVKVKKQAEAIGLFTNDRELLECTCGLIEDVAFDGSLFTYHKNDIKFKLKFHSMKGVLHRTADGEKRR